MLFLLNKEEYDKAWPILNNKGYTWTNGKKLNHRDLHEGKSIVLSFEEKDKLIRIFPLEIYQHDSPIADKAKFDYWISQCKTLEEMLAFIQEE